MILDDGEKMKKIIIILWIGVIMNIFSKVRKPAFAGMWYPADKYELTDMLTDYFSNVYLTEEQTQIEPFGLIAPHAGYIYSGQVASYGYSLLKEKHFDTVILLGSSHRYLENIISIYNGEKYKTPLGEVDIDQDFTSALVSKHNHFVSYDYIHQAEHSLEAQVPFLQYQLDSFKLIPILTSTRNPQLLSTFAHHLVDLIEKSDKKILLVCSTDMSHYHSYDEAVKMDHKTLDLIQQKEWERLQEHIQIGKCELCGFQALQIFIQVMQAFSSDENILLKYANSGDAMGATNADQVVGYATIAFPLQKKKNTNFTVSEKNKSYLLSLAHNSIKQNLETNKNYFPSKPENTFLQKKLAVFVTLRKEGQLRGCIGQLVAREPLYMAVANMAQAAAFDDHRFSKVQLQELADIQIEISILSPQQRIYDYKEIKMGVDGVWIRKGVRSGVFLPQVAEETNWDRETFLENLCLHKAFLPADSYKDPSTELYVFQVVKFHD